MKDLASSLLFWVIVVVVICSFWAWIASLTLSATLFNSALTVICSAGLLGIIIFGGAIVDRHIYPPLE
jgi:hypothetical protein